MRGTSRRTHTTFNGALADQLTRSMHLTREDWGRLDAMGKGKVLREKGLFVVQPLKGWGRRTMAGERGEGR